MHELLRKLVFIFLFFDFTCRFGSESSLLEHSEYEECYFICSLIMFLALVITNDQLLGNVIEWLHPMVREPAEEFLDDVLLIRLLPEEGLVEDEEIGRIFLGLLENQEWIQENNELEGQRVEEIENPEWNPREEAQVENLGEELIQMRGGGRI